MVRKCSAEFVRVAGAAALVAAGLALVPALAHAQQADEVERRLAAEAEVTWRSPDTLYSPVKVRLVGINDLHGHLQTRARAAGSTGARPMGGAAVLKAWIDHERRQMPKRTLVLVAGDSIGASPPVSGLLRDEPTMAFLNELADGKCPPLRREWAATASPVVTQCRVVATVGNHEFDKGDAELERLLYGGRHADGPVLGADWKGMRIPYVAANVVKRDGQKPFLPGSAIVDLKDVKIGVIGAVTLDTAALVPAHRIAAIQFLPEAQRVNAEIAKLKARGVNAIVLLLHEGLATPVTPQPGPLSYSEVTGRLAEIARALEPGVDVIVSAHTHKFTNLMLPGRDGRPILVTQARSYGLGFSETDLTIDRANGEVVAFASRILTPWADDGPGLKPDKSVERLVAAAARVTEVQENRAVGAAAGELTRAENADGESTLGNLVADAQRAAAGTDFAFMNKGGIRNDLDAGPVTWGELRAVQPFGNTLLRMTLTGEQILRLLEQQWSGPHAETPYFLRPSGLAYTYDLRRPPGSRVVDTRDADGLPLDPRRNYTVVANDFLYGGGDYFSVFAEGRDVQPVMLDVDALEKYVAGAAAPVTAAYDGRMKRLDVPGR